jgi:hypothetical protein
MATTDSIAIGTAPWGESGPDLAFLRLPAAIVGDIERVATIANGASHRQNIVGASLRRVRKFFAVSGVIDEMTKPPIVTQIVEFEGMPERMKLGTGMSRRKRGQVSAPTGS